MLQIRKSVLCLFSIVWMAIAALPVKAQGTPPDNYRTSANPHYWKNRPPFPGYWQQDVHYKLNATLNDESWTINGTEELTYWNNSPDTLYFVYFHLYQNAFQPGSYSDELYKENKAKPYYGYWERQGKDEVVSNLKADGKEVRTSLDNTILKVYLNTPLLPNSSVTFNMDFATYFDIGSVRRRMKLFMHDGYKHFDCVHWYPRIAVYDRKGGWFTDQHLGREFYGDYGTYDVNLTLPSQYIMDGTGVMLNENEMLPPDLRAKLDIKNFKDKPLNQKPSEIIKPDGTKKTWRFHAENVHDFAWTADPTYRIGEVDWHGIRCIALAQEQVASRWQDADSFTARVIETYSRDFGMYEWPKIIVADARDGMEYPMITLDGGLSPDYHDVLAHEVGHMWFFGMLGNNETYRAFMDEGFTQFLTIWSETHIDGPYEKKARIANRYVRRFTHHEPTREERLIQPYARTADDEDALPINTHSDYFNGAIGHGGGYAQVYYRAGTMLYNLEYVLGDSLFLAAMKHYVSQWKFCHPYPEDFRNSIIQFTHINLNWFFDQWLETTKYIDYSIKKVKHKKDGSYEITFARKGDMQMPLDFTVYTKDGKAQNFYVPNSYFIKKTNATVLKPWIGWNNIYPTYKAEIQVDGKIKNIIIDTSMRMADAYMMDNQWKKHTKLYFDALIWRSPERRYYEMYMGPSLWYNAVDGIKAGIHLNGNYFNKTDFFQLTAYYNTHLLRSEGFQHDSASRMPISFNLAYSRPLRKLDRDLNWNINLRMMDGLYLGSLGITKTLHGNNTLTAYYKAMIRPHASDTDYLMYPGQWVSNRWNNTLNMELKHAYSARNDNGTLNLKVRTSGPGSDYSYSTLTAEVLNNTAIKKLQLRTRGIISYIDGSNVAPESQLYLASGNPEEMMENRYVRSKGFVPADWLGYGNDINHFQYGGGLNLRGYAGYLAPSGKDTAQRKTFSGTAGAAINAELEFSQYIKFHPRWIRQYFSMSTYLFGDAGVINKNAPGEKLSLDDVRMDAGIGAALTIKSWYPLQKTHPVTIRFDMPLFVSAVPYQDNGQYFKFRWVVGIGRAF